MFLCAEITKTLEEQIEAIGFPLEKTTTALGSQPDLQRTVSVLTDSTRGNSACAVALDGYQFKADFQLGLKNAGCRLLVMDDFGHSDFYHADFVLNQNISARPDLYGKRGNNTELLLGPRYALLRPEFLESRAQTREIPRRAQRLLVTMGGADPDNVTLKVIEALHDSGFDVRVVVGGSNPHLPVLRQAANAASKGATSVELVINASNMPELMRWADIAIAAGGSTSWELAFMGLPTLFVILADNQKESTLELERHGFGVCLGEQAKLGKDRLRGAIEALSGDHERRMAFATRGRQIVDGLGADRVVALLRDTKRLQLGAVTESDLGLVWDWANDATTRASSFQSEPISWEEHQRWGQTKIADPNCYFWIATTEEL